MGVTREGGIIWVGGDVYASGSIDRALSDRLVALERTGVQFHGRTWGRAYSMLPAHTSFAAPADFAPVGSFRGQVNDAGAPQHLRGFGAGDVEETPALLEAMRQALVVRGLRPDAIARTWFFLANIGRDYARFNALRSEVYSGWGLDVLPASTGIGADAGQALTAELLIAPGWERHQSPVQPDPMTYGVSFSRAAAVEYAGVRRLYVSGLAAIGADGRSMCAGDTTAQLDATLSAAEALLTQAAMSCDDIVEGTLYVKLPPDRLDATRRLAARWPGAPVITVVATVCRDELRCEIELLAAKER